MHFLENQTVMIIGQDDLFRISGPDRKLPPEAILERDGLSRVRDKEAFEKASIVLFLPDKSRTAFVLKMRDVSVRTYKELRGRVG